MIRRRHDLGIAMDIYIVTHWPDAETVTAGPFERYSDALEHARVVAGDNYAFIWFDYARHGEPERLDRLVGGET